MDDGHKGWNEERNSTGRDEERNSTERIFLLYFKKPEAG